MPSSSSVRIACSLSRMRIVQPSPRWVGSVVTRRSTLRSSTLTRPVRPGVRASRRCPCRHQLHAGDDAGDHPLRDPRRLVQHPVDPEADPHLVLIRLEVDVGRALAHRLGEDRVDELDHRGVVGGLVELGDLGLSLLLLLLVDRLGDRRLERVHAADQGVDVVRRRDRDAGSGARSSSGRRRPRARPPGRPSPAAGSRGLHNRPGSAR